MLRPVHRPPILSFAVQGLAFVFPAISTFDDILACSRKSKTRIFHDPLAALVAIMARSHGSIRPSSVQDLPAASFSALLGLWMVLLAMLPANPQGVIDIVCPGRLRMWIWLFPGSEHEALMSSARRLIVLAARAALSRRHA